VSDTGFGIDPALLPQVFERFVQADRSLARSSGGLGLGLSVVKGVAEQHGGSVTARSDGLGTGAEFALRLPLAAAPADARCPPPGEQHAPAAAPGRHRVLVVDDNEDAALTLAELIELSGHTTAVAHDGPTALSLARADPPDIVLCDIGLPGMSGYEVARALRSEQGAELLLVAISGYAQPEDVRRALEAGFDHHLAKPPQLTDVEQLLQKAARRGARTAADPG
jgi:CheY-like chemotaxis protein